MDFIALVNYISAMAEQAGTSQWETVKIFTIHGGWMIFFMFFFHLMFELFHDRMQGIFAHHQKYHLLAVNIPKLNEQTPRAVENFFNQISGAHGTQDLLEKYWKGEHQLAFSFEIVSIDGYLQFLIRTPVKFRDLVEAALYAQYPDCEVVEVEDYMKDVPTHFPHAEYDLWGTELTLVKGNEFPIATYRDFEHPVTKQFFKDPMAALLEALSRIGKGEQFWIQIYVKPIGKAWQKQGITFAGKLIADLMKARATPERPFPLLHKGETDLVESVHRKATKNGFSCKMRIAYFARKDVWNPKRVQFGVMGAIKQFSRDDANGFKPLMGATGTSAHYLFVNKKKNHRKHEIAKVMKSRSGSAGAHQFILNVEELATVWHFPLAHAVRNPALPSVEAKRSEPPSRLPLEVEYLDGKSPAPTPSGSHRGMTEIHPGESAKPSAPPTPSADHSTHAPAASHDHGAPPPNLPFA